MILSKWFINNVNKFNVSLDLNCEFCSNIVPIFNGVRAKSAYMLKLEEYI